MKGRGDTNQDATVIFLFGTTHAAMEGEEAIIDAGYWCDVVPRPPLASSTLCGLAIEARRQDLEEISRLLEKAGLAFEIFEPE